MSNEITAMCISVQINGKPYFVNLPQERMMLAVHMISGLSDNGKLNVFPAPDDFKFVKIGDLK